MTQPTLSQIDAFFADPEVHKLASITSKSLPLEICYPGELATTNFLRWLLDPSEGHGLGDMAIKALLTQAWRSSHEIPLGADVVKALSPATVQTSGYSGMVAIAELSLQKRRLDVLAVDASQKLYIAIENKLQAKQSARQLIDYASSLKKMFKGYTGIHAFLDWNEAEPDDDSWIAVGYEWLFAFLREAEERPATTERVRTTLSQFRAALEYEEEEVGFDSIENRAVANIAARHEDVIGVMGTWMADKVSERAAVLAGLINGTSDIAIARRRLYQIFLRRADEWGRCAKVVGMAPFVTRLQQDFDGVLVDQRRTWTAFSLARFEEFQDPRIDVQFYPAYVTVRRDGDAYEVNAFVEVTSVREDVRERLIELATAMIARDKRLRYRSSASTVYRVKTRKALTRIEALKIVADDMRVLANSIASLILRPS